MKQPNQNLHCWYFWQIKYNLFEPPYLLNPPFGFPTPTQVERLVSLENHKKRRCVTIRSNLISDGYYCFHSFVSVVLEASEESSCNVLSTLSYPFRSPVVFKYGKDLTKDTPFTAVYSYLIRENNPQSS